MGGEEFRFGPLVQLICLLLQLLSLNVVRVVLVRARGLPGFVPGGLGAQLLVLLLILLGQLEFLDLSWHTDNHRGRGTQDE